MPWGIFKDNNIWIGASEFIAYSGVCAIKALRNFYHLCGCALSTKDFFLTTHAISRSIIKVNFADRQE